MEEFSLDCDMKHLVFESETLHYRKYYNVKQPIQWQISLQMYKKILILFDIFTVASSQTETYSMYIVQYLSIRSVYWVTGVITSKKKICTVPMVNMWLWQLRWIKHNP